MSKDILGSLVRVLVTVPEDRLGLMQDFANKLAGSDGDTWVQQGKQFLRKEACWIKEVVSEVSTQLISGVETLELDETDGKATIARATETFPGYIDRDFSNWGCDIKSEPTKKTKVSVHEMIKDGTFEKIWNSMSNDLNSLCLTQPQIIQFVQNHRKWLRTEGYGTFFLFKANNEFFVARVFFGVYGQLRVLVDRFSRDDVWGAGCRHRVVSPQLTLIPSVP